MVVIKSKCISLSCLSCLIKTSITTNICFFFKLFLVFLIIFSTKFEIIATIKGWFQSIHPGVDKSKYVVVKTNLNYENIGNENFASESFDNNLRALLFSKNQSFFIRLQIKIISMNKGDCWNVYHLFCLAYVLAATVFTYNMVFSCLLPNVKDNKG